MQIKIHIVKTNGQAFDEDGVSQWLFFDEENETFLCDGGNYPYNEIKELTIKFN